MKTFCEVCLIVAFVLLGGLFGQASGHDQYHNWKMPDSGVSCCNDKDCGPTRAYLDPETDQWRALNPRTGEWVLVPPAKILKGPSPDGRTHWCGVGTLTYCFMPGDTKS